MFQVLTALRLVTCVTYGRSDLSARGQLPATSRSPKVRPAAQMIVFAIARALHCIFRMCYVREGCSFMAETGTVKEEAPVSNLRLYEQLELNKAKKEEGPRLLLALLHRFSVSCLTAFQQSFKKNTRRTLHLHQVCPSYTGMLCAISFPAQFHSYSFTLLALLASLL